MSVRLTARIFLLLLLSVSASPSKPTPTFEQKMSLDPPTVSNLSVKEIILLTAETSNYRYEITDHSNDSLCTIAIQIGTDHTLGAIGSETLC